MENIIVKSIIKNSITKINYVKNGQNSLVRFYIYVQIQY